MVRDFQTASPDRYLLLKEFAKHNRNNQTDAESFLWQQIKGNALGVKFKRQHIIYDFIVDFVCLEKNLIIEVDGGYHYRSEQLEYDAYRTEDLERYGFHVIRFDNNDVLFNTNNVIKKIKEQLNYYG